MARLIVDIETDITEDVDAVVAAFESVLALLTAQSVIIDARNAPLVFGQPGVIVDTHEELPQSERFVTLWAETEWWERVKLARNIG